MTHLVSHRLRPSPFSRSPDDAAVFPAFHCNRILFAFVGSTWPPMTNIKSALKCQIMYLGSNVYLMNEINLIIYYLNIKLII